MESHDKPHYEKLDLEPFTFTSPTENSSDLNYESFLEETAHESFISDNPSSLHEIIELYENNSQILSALSPDMETNELDNNQQNLASLQQDWRQPLQQPKPKIDQIVGKRNFTNAINYLISLNKMHKLQNRDNTPLSKRTATTKPTKKEFATSLGRSSRPVQKNPNEQQLMEIIYLLQKQTLAKIQSKRK